MDAAILIRMLNVPPPKGPYVHRRPCHLGGTIARWRDFKGMKPSDTEGG